MNLISIFRIVCAIIVLSISFILVSYFISDESRSNVVDRPEIVEQLMALDYSSNPYSGPVDIVISWLDASDAAWQKSFQSFGYAFVPERILSSKELELNLVTISSFVPHCRHVFVVTNGVALPSLDFLPLPFKEKIKMVNQDSIIDAKYRPSFNSNAIESNLYKIPGLSEIFIYLNDDMMFAQPFDVNRIVNAASGGAIVIPSTRRKNWCDRETLNMQSFEEPHNMMYANTMNIFINHYGYCIPYINSAHSPYILSKTLLNVTRQIFPSYYDQLNRNRMRDPVLYNKNGDMLFLYLSLYVGHHYYRIKFVGKGEFSTTLLNQNKPIKITEALIDTFTNPKEVDFITVQQLHAISDEQFSKACDAILDAACLAVDGNDIHSCKNLEYFKHKHSLCVDRPSKLMKQIANLTSYINVVNPNFNYDKELVLVPHMHSSDKPAASSSTTTITVAAANSSVITDKEPKNSLSLSYLEHGVFREKVRDHTPSSNSESSRYVGPNSRIKKLQVTFFSGDRVKTVWSTQCLKLKADKRLNGSDIIFLNELHVAFADNNSNNYNYDRNNNSSGASGRFRKSRADTKDSTPFEFARCMSMNYVYAADSDVSIHNRVVGLSGIAIMSKFPLRNIELLSPNCSADRKVLFASISLAKSSATTDESIDINTIDLVVTHLDSSEPVNAICMESITSSLRRRGASGGSLLAGNLGNPSGSESSSAANILFSSEKFFSPWATNRNKVSRGTSPSPYADWIMAKGPFEPIPGSADVIDSRLTSSHNYVTVHLKLNGVY